MLDVFYFAFVMLGVLAFTRVARGQELSLLTNRALIVCTGVMFGAAMACKWNGIVFLACIVLLSGILWRTKAMQFRRIGPATLTAGLIVVPFLMYFAAFAIANAAVHLPFSLREFATENMFMWKWHRAVPGNPGFNVRWYQWFFRSSPERGLSYLMGNFIVMWTGIGALILCGWNLWRHRGQAVGEAMLLLLYSANILQWLIIPQKSTCYYYYYPSAMLLGVAIALVLSRTRQPSIAGVRVSIVLTLASFLFFLYCYPHMAGLQAPFDCALGCWP
jgi:dolichyl-phosphate-mannose--protein O-mannosyl transferase